MGRRENKLNQFRRYVVIGDGQTEQYYLAHLKDLFGYKYSIRPLLFNNITIEKAARLIKDLLNEGYDMVVYLTDYDVIVNQNKEQKFQKLIERYKNSSKVMICETMPCVEFWFLLHFLKTTREFCNAEEATSFLKKHIQYYSKEESFLKNSKWVKDLCSNGKVDKAIEYAMGILEQKNNMETGSHFPYTKVHLAIQEFEGKIIKTQV